MLLSRSIAREQLLTGFVGCRPWHLPKKTGISKSPMGVQTSLQPLKRLWSGRAAETSQMANRPLICAADRTALSTLTSSQKVLKSTIAARIVPSSVIAIIVAKRFWYAHITLLASSFALALLPGMTFCVMAVVGELVLRDVLIFWDQAVQ